LNTNLKTQLLCAIALAAMLMQSPVLHAGGAGQGAVVMPTISPIGNWIVTHVEGIDVAEGHLRFEIAEGSVFGQAPCNSFNADLIVTDGQFSLGPLDLRGNVCDEDIMEDEHTYLRILQRLSNFEIEADGTLVLSSFGVAMISARPEDH